MNKIQRLKCCDVALAISGLSALASGIYLEATDSRGIASVWLHIVVCTIFMSVVVWHIYLHFNWSNWLSKFKTLKSPVTRILAIAWCLTLITGLAALCQWLVHFSHSGLGGWHGKIGFVFMAIAIAHIIKRIRFFKPKTK